MVQLVQLRQSFRRIGPPELQNLIISCVVVRVPTIFGRVIDSINKHVRLWMLAVYSRRSLEQF